MCVPEYVVVEVVVAGHSNQTPRTGAQGVEDLYCRVRPHLECYVNMYVICYKGQRKPQFYVLCDSGAPLNLHDDRRTTAVHYKRRCIPIFK